jgi:hypothetical protein
MHSVSKLMRIDCCRRLQPAGVSLDSSRRLQPLGNSQAKACGYGISSISLIVLAKVKAQKKVAEDNWTSLDIGAFTHHETAHLLIYAPKALENKLKDIGATLEKHHETASKALEYDNKTSPWEGKLTVYLLTEKNQFTTFVRRIEGRRLEGEESGGHMSDGDTPHAAAGPPRAKRDPGLEWQAASQVAAALLHKKAGKAVPVPEWVLEGFGRATAYRTLPNDKTVRAERKAATKYLTVHGTKDVWGGNLDTTEAPILQASLMDYLAYGPGSSKFVKFVEGFKPEDNVPMKTVAQALEAASIPADTLDKRWKEWAAK